MNTTNVNQTQRLIELGFPDPKKKDYSIDELIRFCENSLFKNYDFIMRHHRNGWCVTWFGISSAMWVVQEKELIDALFEMCIRLKREGAL